jgi:xanthine dehydrogenase accessory factor
MEALFNQYKEEGLDPDFLCRIHTPIGIPIKSQTPWEIAVSIAAEIIKVKNESK